MSVLTSRPLLRWLVPAVAAVAVVGGGAAARTLSASAEPSLPPRSAAQLLVDLQTARTDGLSGTVVKRADLGLPTLPAGLGQGSTDLTSLISGKHTLKVWYSGPDKARVALQGTNGESDIIHNGKDIWTWNSRENTVTHRVTSGAEQQPQEVPSGMPSSPQEAADLALRTIDPTTEVTTGANARVAERPAYELVLAPRDKDSLVGQIRLAIDATEHVPLRVQVYPKGSDTTALEVAFTQVSFTRPDDAQFQFTPPPGAKVTEETATPDAKADGGRPTTEGQDTTRTAVIGTGWTAVLVARTGTVQEQPDAGTEQGKALTGFLDNLPKVNGGRVLTSRLFSVLLTEDGRTLVGAVSPERLGAVATDPAAALK